MANGLNEIKNAQVELKYLKFRIDLFVYSSKIAITSVIRYN